MKRSFVILMVVLLAFHFLIIVTEQQKLKHARRAFEAAKMNCGVVS